MKKNAFLLFFTLILIFAAVCRERKPQTLPAEVKTYPKQITIGDQFEVYNILSRKDTLVIRLLEAEKLKISIRQKDDTLSFTGMYGPILEDDSIYFDSWEFESKQHHLTFYGNKIDSVELFQIGTKDTTLFKF